MQQGARSQPAARRDGDRDSSTGVAAAEVHLRSWQPPADLPTASAQALSFAWAARMLEEEGDPLVQVMQELAQRAADSLARLQATHPAAASRPGDDHLMPPPPPPNAPG
eukprot:13091146-Alexandrium_andersonii.AAC.1